MATLLFLLYLLLVIGAGLFCCLLTLVFFQLIKENMQ